MITWVNCSYAVAWLLVLFYFTCILYCFDFFVGFNWLCSYHGCPVDGDQTLINLLEVKRTYEKCIFPDVIVHGNNMIKNMREGFEDAIDHIKDKKDKAFNQERTKFTKTIEKLTAINEISTKKCEDLMMLVDNYMDTPTNAAKHVIREFMKPPVDMEYTTSLLRAHVIL